MLESFPFSVIVGILLGFLAGLGTGGGSLLILWLTLVLNTPAEIARGINLMFFIPSAIVACLFRWKKREFHIQKIIPAVIAGCITAGIFSWISTQIDTALLKKLFGGLLLFVGIRELFYRPRNAR